MNLVASSLLGLMALQVPRPDVADKIRLQLITNDLDLLRCILGAGMRTRQHNFTFELVDVWHIGDPFLTLWRGLSLPLDFTDCVSHHCVIFSDEAAALKHDGPSLRIQVQGGSI